jgi:hypothetical protein
VFFIIILLDIELYKYCHTQIPLRHLIFLGYILNGGGGQSRSRVHGMRAVM